MPPPRPDEPDNRNQNDRSDDFVEFMEVFAKILPVFPSLHSQISKAKTPRERSGKGVHVKSKTRHASDAGRQSDEGTNHRQHTTDEYGEVAKSDEEEQQLKEGEMNSNPRGGCGSDSDDE